MNNIIEVIKNNELAIIYENESMVNHCTMRVGGVVRLLVIPNDINCLVEIIKLINKSKVSFKIIGRGSNLIFDEGLHNIVVIKISNVIDDINVSKDIIEVGAGYSLQKFAKLVSKQGCSGFEFAGGIPGSVGGAVVMNAGAHTSDISKVLLSVEVLKSDGSIVEYDNAQCAFAYRHSIFQNTNDIIIKAYFKNIHNDEASVYKKMSGNLEYRKLMQPLSMPSCGSTFRNPLNNHAGKLIESCDLKGFKLGGAQVSEKHANFVINCDNATALDIENLISHIKKEVSEKFNIDLQTELEIVKRNCNE